MATGKRPQQADPDAVEFKPAPGLSEDWADAWRRRRDQEADDGQLAE